MRRRPEQARLSARRLRGPAVLRFIGIVCMAIGLGGVVACGLSIHAETSSPRTAEATGSIVEVNHYPVVQFATSDGNIVRFTNFGQASPRHAGEAVTVLYDPADPQDAAIRGFAGRWFAATLEGTLGGLFLLLGILFAVTGRPAPAAQEAASKRR